MSDPTYSQRVRVTNPQGLHLRPAHAFVTMANRFRAKVRVGKDGEVVDGKSILSLMSLMASQGVELEIQATGADAADALKALAELMESQHLYEAADQDAPFHE